MWTKHVAFGPSFFVIAPIIAMRDQRWPKSTRVYILQLFPPDPHPAPITALVSRPQTTDLCLKPERFRAYLAQPAFLQRYVLQQRRRWPSPIEQALPPSATRAVHNRRRSEREHLGLGISLLPGCVKACLGLLAFLHDVVVQCMDMIDDLFG